MRLGVTKFALALTLTFSFGTSLCETRPSEPDLTQAQISEMMCAQTKCQRNLHVTLVQKDGSTYEHTFPTFPAVVQPVGILVVAGQTVFVEADTSDGKLVNLQAVDSVVHPEKTIIVKLEQTEDRGMMLTTTNPFDETLKFDMGITPLESDDLYKTSSCPILKGSFETWPYPIFQVLLGNGRVVAKDYGLCD
ncbi:hypothetical protein FNZ56_10715 [Pseudoluteimonas lycopersici]|jgi:hypothetical protein|uniref:Uncharacterized protein n=1 Tax=Pseudoluteimonas lycopersici TaxID=1324796 RepID=A0A516V702_9GAMM|nr:hypothetical protein [Lysobacter lycopersici]QDQ74319.1 hypothetical protein FNZ56_10715 [Lysobacter lycopersici]